MREWKPNIRKYLTQKKNRWVKEEKIYKWHMKNQKRNKLAKWINISSYVLFKKEHTLKDKLKLWKLKGWKNIYHAQIAKGIIAMFNIKAKLKTKVVTTEKGGYFIIRWSIY